MTKDMAYPRGMELHGSGWRIKKRVPKDLAAHYPTSFLRFQSGEADKDAAAVKILRWEADKAEEFERLRTTGSRLKRTLTDAEADHLCALSLASRLSADEEVRDLGEVGFFPHAEAAREGTDRDARSAIAGHGLGSLAEVAADWLISHGYAIDPASQEFRSFARKFAKVHQQGSKVMQQRDAGEWVESPAAPVGAPMVAAKPASSGAPMLADVVRGYLDKQDKTAPMFRKQEPALALLLEVLGNRPVDTLRQKGLDDFFALLCRLPSRWSVEKRRNHVGVVELARMEWPKCISPKTFDDSYMAALRPFIRDCRRLYGDQGFPVNLDTNGIRYTGIRAAAKAQVADVRAYLSLPASCQAFRTGESRYSSTVLVPSRISALACMPAPRSKRSPSISSCIAVSATSAL